MSTLALLGASAILAWSALPLLCLLARRNPEAAPAARFRSLLIAMALGASLFALPIARAAFEPAPAPLRPAGIAGAMAAARETARSVAHAATPPLAWIGAAWALLALAGLARLMADTASTALLSRGLPGLPEPAASTAERLARELGIEPPLIVSSHRADLPFVRAFPTTVVLPARMVQQLKPEALELVLRHELTHLARLDHLSAVALELLHVPFTYHPSAEHLRREIGLAREMAVDARVGAVAPKAYAHLLVDLAELHRFGPREAGEVALEPSSLEKRIEMMTTRNARRPSRLWPLLCLGLAFAALATVVPIPFAVADVQGPQVIELKRGRTFVLEPGATYVRLAIGDPALVDVRPRTNHQVELTGLAAGRTTLLVWLEDGKRQSWLLSVK